MTKQTILASDISPISNEPDAIKRNKKISAAYADLYLRNPKLKWSGAAAFASKQVGCGLKTAMDMQNSLVLGHAGDVVYKGLATANKAIFDEIYPIMRFYNSFGMARLERCASSHRPPVSELLLSVFRQIENGDVAEGNKNLLYHKQNDVLGKVLYNNTQFDLLFEANQAASKFGVGRTLGAQETIVSFSAACRGGTEIKFEGKDLSNFNERWPYAQHVAATFDKLLNAEPQNRLLQEQLKLIIQNGNLP